VHSLRQLHNVTDIRMKLAASKPQLMFPFTNPEHDVDVSGQMQGEGGVELGETKLVGGPRWSALAGCSDPEACCIGRHTCLYSC
jgi:hypothetical protein